MKTPNHSPEPAPASATRPQVRRPVTRSIRLRIGAHDQQVLDRELLVGEVVDRALRLLVGVVDGQRLGVVEVETVAAGADGVHASSLAPASTAAGRAADLHPTGERAGSPRRGRVAE